MEQNPDRISRRRMLKRIGAAGAIAWTAPVLSSLQTPAFARHYPNVCHEPCDFRCADPNTLQFCNAADPSCVCDRTQEGDCFCLFGDILCSALLTCNSSAECAGSGCVGVGCCGPPADGKAGYCLPPCGVAGPSATGPTWSGR